MRHRIERQWLHHIEKRREERKFKIMTIQEIKKRTKKNAINSSKGYQLYVSVAHLTKGVMTPSLTIVGLFVWILMASKLNLPFKKRKNP